MRKVKTFNVDVDVYKKLIAIIKKYGVNASLSSFVNNCLEELLTHLQDMEEIKKQNTKSKLPMSFVINEMTKSIQNKKTLLPSLFYGGHTEEQMQEYLANELLSKWEEDYEAQKLGISVDMYSFLKDGGYVLAPNKQYLIEEKTGKKYIALRTDRGREASLLEIREE